MDPIEKIRRCREYALKFVDIQREEFKRLGVFGDWDNPYMTMAPAYEGVIVREFGRLVGRGLVYKGLKPVHWCMHCKTALAQAEVEYEDAAGAVGLRASSRWSAPLPGLPDGAEALAGDLDDHAVDAARRTSRSPSIPRRSTSRSRRRRRDADRRRQARRRLRRAWPGSSGRAGWRTLPGRELGRARVPPRLDRPHRQGRGGAVRRDGHRHRARPHRARPRRGGLRARPRARAARSTTRWTTTGASSPRSSTSPG